MSKTVQQKMHEQHRKWQSDYETWRADIEQWKKQLRTALGELREVEDMLRDSLDALEAHADDAWENEQRRYAHELALGEELRAGMHATDKDWAHRYHEYAARHEGLADAHGRIKKHHHGVVAEVMRLVAAARRAM